MAVDSVAAMTSHHSSPEFRLRRPGALIAALPAVLGFVPEKSLVLVSLEEGRMGAVMRADLSSDLETKVEHLAEIAASSGAESVIAVIVDEEGALCPMCNENHRRLAAALAEELESRDIGLYATHVVDRVDSGGSWHCVDGCGAGGAVEDPGSSPLAAAAVLDGRRLYGRRSELQAVVAVAKTADCPQRAAAIEARSRERAEEWRTDPDGCGRRDVEAAISAIARVRDGSPLSDTELAKLACGLGDVAVRDTLFALAVGAEADRAEALWSLLCRELPDPWRVNALVLLAYSAYARGDGPLAGLSLEAALRSEPGNRMAGMLDTALQSGMRPEHIRELAGTGFRLANRLGVRLPQQEPPGKWAV